MIEKLQKTIEEQMGNQHFDAIAVGIIDFDKFEFNTVEWHDGKFIDSRYDRFFFDLASLTKPLTLASTYLLDPGLFTKEMKLLLNHQAGLTSGGRISVNNWREYILKFKIAESPSLYSDYSALRSMLEIEKVYDRDLYSICSFFWNKELLHWSDLTANHKCPVTGMRRKRKIQGVVHDDNAYYLKEKVSHAGLFSTIDGLCESLLKLEDKTNMINQMSKSFDENHDRFLNGWDTVSDPKDTLAGTGCSSKTFGHLGFTGTSIWIDCDKRRGVVTLTNATQNYWYDRKGLSQLRREIGKLAWSL
jgi:CubicO group peptidase (beta-lactamase class C family)